MIIRTFKHTLLAIASSAFSASAIADFTTPDTGFGGGDGIVEYNVGTGLTIDELSIATDSRDRIYILVRRKNSSNVFSGLVMRLNPDGAKDNCFGPANNGTLLPPSGDYQEPAIAVDEHNDRLYLLRRQFPDLQVMALSLEPATLGNRDTSFNGGADLVINLPGIHDGGRAVVDPRDGSLLFIGPDFVQDRPSGENRPLVARIRESGSLDTSFGNNGFKIEGTKGDVNAGGAVDSDGRILTVGITDSIVGQEVTDVLFRYLPNGARDTSFSGDGFHNLNPNGNGIGTWVSARVQANGTSRVVGITGSHFDEVSDDLANKKFMAAQLKYNGALDTSFDGDGKLVAATNPASLASDASFYGSGLLIMSDGRIVYATLAGATQNKVRVESFDGFGQPLVFTSDGLCTD